MFADSSFRQIEETIARKGASGGLRASRGAAAARNEAEAAAATRQLEQTGRLAGRRAFYDIRGIPGDVLESGRAFRTATTVGGKATAALGAVQGLSQAAAVGLAGYHGAKGFGQMWTDGTFNGHEFGSALKSGIDAITGGVGTVDAVLGAGRTVGNCVNNHGATGCARAAFVETGRLARTAEQSTEKCFRQHGFYGCIGSAGRATGEGLWHFGKNGAVALGHAAKSVAEGAGNMATQSWRAGTWCAGNIRQCAHNTQANMARGMSNVGRALTQPWQQCSSRNGGAGGCAQSVTHQWRNDAMQYRLRGLQQQEAEALARGQSERASQLRQKEARISTELRVFQGRRVRN